MGLETELAEAIRENSLTKVSKILDEGFDVNSPIVEWVENEYSRYYRHANRDRNRDRDFDPDRGFLNVPPLGLAIINHSDTEIIELLIDRGASFSPVAENLNALRLAIKSVNFEAVKLLCHRGKFEFKYGYYVDAIAEMDFDMVRFLFDPKIWKKFTGAPAKFDIEHKEGKLLRTAVVFHYPTDSMDIINLLLQQGALAAHDEFAEACKHRIPDVADVLYSYRSQNILRSKVGRLQRGPLFYAILTSDELLAKVIMDGNPWDRDTEGNTFLVRFFSRKEIAVEKLKFCLDELLKKFDSPLELQAFLNTPNLQGRKLLHRYFQDCLGERDYYSQFIVEFIDNGYDYTTVDEYGKNIFHYLLDGYSPDERLIKLFALIFYQEKGIEMLKSYFQMKDNRGETPLDIFNRNHNDFRPDFYLQFIASFEDMEKTFKEKVVAKKDEIYDFFRRHKIRDPIDFNPNVWDELFPSTGTSSNPEKEYLEYEDKLLGNLSSESTKESSRPFDSPVFRPRSSQTSLKTPPPETDSSRSKSFHAFRAGFPEPRMMGYEPFKPILSKSSRKRLESSQDSKPPTSKASTLDSQSSRSKTIRPQIVKTKASRPQPTTKPKTKSTKVSKPKVEEIESPCVVPTLGVAPIRVPKKRIAFGTKTPV